MRRQIVHFKAYFDYKFFNQEMGYTSQIHPRSASAFLWYKYKPMLFFSFIQIYISLWTRILYSLHGNLNNLVTRFEIQYVAMRMRDSYLIWVGSGSSIGHQYILLWSLSIWLMETSHNKSHFRISGSRKIQL